MTARPKKTSHNYDQTPIDGKLRPVRDLLLIREEKVAPSGLIQPVVDLNRTTPWLYGTVEAIGPKVMDCKVGDRVFYPAGAGEFRVPGDDDVRIMKEDDVAGVVLSGCCGIELAPGQFSGCDQSAGDCPVCGR